MSMNRSVQSAQRRRATPPVPENIRGPGTSINSSQMFSNQPTNNIPSGRLADSC